MKKRRDSVIELQQLSFQLRALAYLLSLSGRTGGKELERIHWGLGKILERLGRRTMCVARDVEQIELLRTKKN